MATTDDITALLVSHAFDGEPYPPTGEMWVSCSCNRCDMWGEPDPWPVTPIKREEAVKLHAAHVAQVISAWLGVHEGTQRERC